MAYVDYNFKPDEKISDVASQFNTTVDDFMKMNNVQPPFPKYMKDLPSYAVDGDTVKIPYVLNGKSTFEDFTNDSQQSVGVVYENDSILTRSLRINRTNITQPKKSVYVPPNVKHTCPDCYITIDYMGSGSGTTWHFPCYPETVSDSNQASYNGISLLGSPEPIQMYSHSGPRSVSVSFTMHSDMCNDMQSSFANDINYIYDLTAAIEGCCYAKNTGVSAVRVVLTIGKNIHICGIISNVSTQYSGPLLDRTGTANADGSRNGTKNFMRYAVVTLGFSVTEVMGGGAPDFNYVSRQGGYR